MIPQELIIDVTKIVEESKKEGFDMTSIKIIPADTKLELYIAWEEIEKEKDIVNL